MFCKAQHRGNKQHIQTVINSERVFSSAAFADPRSPRKEEGDTTICLYAAVIHLQSTNI